MLGTGEILVMPCTPQVSHLYTHSPVWNANSKFCFLFSPDSLEKSKAWGKRNVDSLNLMPFNKSPIYAVFIYLGKEVMYESAECQSIGPGVCEILNFDILKKFSISKTIPVFDFMHRIGRNAGGCHTFTMTFVTSSDWTSSFDHHDKNCETDRGINHGHFF